MHLKPFPIRVCIIRRASMSLKNLFTDCAKGRQCRGNLMGGNA